MKKSLLSTTALAALAACAQPSSKALPPVQLADGRVYQDVVTIAADGKGTAPTVTMVNQYALSEGPKGAASNCDDSCVTQPVATAAASQPGVVNTLVRAVGPAAVAATISGNNRNNNSQVVNVVTGGGDPECYTVGGGIPTTPTRTVCTDTYTGPIPPSLGDVPYVP